MVTADGGTGSVPSLVSRGGRVPPVGEQGEHHDGGDADHHGPHGHGQAQTAHERQAGHRGELGAETTSDVLGDRQRAAE